METQDPRAWIPQVETLLERPEVLPYVDRLSRPVASRTIARALDSFRNKLVSRDPGDALDESSVRHHAMEECLKALQRKSRQGLRKVLNGTGVVLHTNLGRSPIPKAMWDEAREINTGYSNLEFDLESGERGSRGGLVFDLLCALTGAQAALAVNNNAAAMLLVLGALAKDKDVIVSRGEAVQIGGGFRIPDILALSGSILKEVGTTNITTARDYLDAVGPDTAAVLLVHSSNFALRGFVEKPSVSALSKALPQRIVCIVDQGSGSTQEGLDSEPSVSSLLRAGADLVCFSGDKILGGPQAGLIVGRADLIGLLAKHPLMRAFRPGKTILSLLEASLAAKLRGNERQGPFAAQAALRLSAEKGMKTLRVLGRKILRLIPQDFKAGIRLTQTHATLGGGSTPDETMPSLALRLSSSHSARAVTSALRQAPVPLVARIEDESVLIDLIALADEDPRLIAQTIVFALTKEAP